MTKFKKITGNITTVNQNRFLLIVFTVSLILISLISYYIFHHTFLTTDENAFIFQAKTFSKGKLYVSSHPLRVFFDSDMLVNDGRYFSRYFPSHALMLVPGIWLNFPYLIPHLLSALSLIMIYLIAKECYNKKIAIYSTLLTLTSPLYLFISSTLYSQITAFFFLSLFILCFIKMISCSRFRYPIFAGIGLGVAFNARPLDSLAVAIPLVLYGLYNLRGERKYSFRFLIFLWCLSIFVIIFLSYNKIITGSPFYTTFDYYSDLYWPRDHYGFSEFHNFQKGVTNTFYNLNRLNRWLFGWPFSLIFIFLFPMIRRKKVWDYIFLSIFIFLIVALFFYWSPGVPCTGPLYYYTAIGVLSILTIRSISSLYEISNGMRGRIIKAILTIFIIISLFSSFFIFFPKKIYYLYGISLNKLDPILLIEKKRIENAIIFLQNAPWGKTSKRYVINSPDLNDDILFVNSLGKKNKLLMDYYPKKNCFIYKYNYETKKGTLSPLSRNNVE